MASMAAKVTAAFLESKGMNFDLIEEKNVIVTGFGLDNLEGIKVIINFDEGDETVGVRAYGIAKFPESKIDAMYKLVNSLNVQFRWIKFVVDEEDFCINAEDDAIIQLDSCGEEVFRCCLHFATIVDEAYPIIMKGVFA